MESKYLVQSLETVRGRNVWHLIELDLRRSVLREISVPERKLHCIDAIEAFSRRETIDPEKYHVPQTQLLDNLRVFFGLVRGIDGAGNLLARQTNPIFFCVEPDTGTLCGFTDNPDDAFGHELGVVKVATSSLFAIRRPRLHHCEVIGELSQEALSVVTETIALINRIDQVQRIGICESIT